MRGHEMLQTLENLSPEYIEAAAVTPKAKKTGWLKWSTIAACLCLVLSVATPLLRHKCNPDGDEPVRAIAGLDYNGKCYEAVDIPEILEMYGLPPKITVDMAGEHLTYLKSDGGTRYECTMSQTDIELYRYAPSECDGVYVLRDGETWYAVLFCNFYQSGRNTSVALTELYRIYGIETANDIVSITEMNWNRRKAVGTPVTIHQEIAEFYDMTIALQSYGNDDFQEQMFGDYHDEEKLVQAHRAFADDYRCLRIETTDGLRFFLDFYPNFDWIRAGGAMSYFKIENQMHEWLNRNLN